MQLTEEQLTNFKKLYKKRFGKSLNDKEARERGKKIIRLVKEVYSKTS